MVAGELVEGRERALVAAGDKQARAIAAEGDAVEARRQRQKLRHFLRLHFDRGHQRVPLPRVLLPLQFLEGQSAPSLGLDGTESFDITGLEGGSVQPKQEVTLKIQRLDGSNSEARVILRIDTPIEIEYYKNGGILPFVLRQLIS